MAWLRGGLKLVLGCALLAASGCADTTKAPFRPRPKLDAGAPERQERDSGEPEGEAGSMAPPTPMRPTGIELTEMIAALRELGADVDDPDRLCTGWEHACGIDSEGKVHCFGSNPDGRSTPPKQDVKVVQVGCGINFSCSLDEEGAIACWGAGSDESVLDMYNQTQSVPPKGTFKQIAIGAGGFHGCAIDDNDAVQCWGGGALDKPADAKGNFGQARPPEGAFKRIAAGEAHTCGILTSGEITCWGGHGDGCFPPYDYDCGQITPPEGVFTDLAAGELHNCALREDGSATCWGKGLADTPCVPDSGLGEFDCGQGLIPPELQMRIKRIRAGNLHTCVITDDYDAVCWGWNSAKQIEAPILYAFSQVVGGDQFSCGWATDSTVQCWGAVPGEVPEELAFPPKK
jgi:alpha-tubulin suppressor-like RCC1 family protein